MSRMEMGDYFLCAITILQFCAVCAFVWKRRWHEAVVYACYAVAQLTLLLLSLKARA